MSLEWHRVEVEQIVFAYESHWRGVWRHFWNTLRGRKPTYVPFKVVISAWIYGGEKIEIRTVSVEAKWL